jgi:hypothetical protein
MEDKELNKALKGQQRSLASVHFRQNKPSRATETPPGSASRHQ